MFLKGVPTFLYRAVNFIKSSVTYYLECHDILIEPLSLFVCMAISLKRSIHICKNRSLWFYFRTMIRLIRSGCVCRNKNKVSIYCQFSENVFVTYVGTIRLLENAPFLCSV